MLLVKMERPDIKLLTEFTTSELVAELCKRDDISKYHIRTMEDECIIKSDGLRISQFKPATIFVVIE